MLCNALLIAVFFFYGSSANALEGGDQAALNDTQKLLHNQQALDNFTKDNPDAAKTLDQVKQITGGNKQQIGAVNDISSDIFADMVRANPNDSAAIFTKLQQALKDPKGFMNNLTPEQQARIRGLASEIDKKKAESAKK